MILWIMAFSIMVNTFLICVLVVQIHKNAIRYVKLEEWAEYWLKRLEHKHEALECQIVNAAARIAEIERLMPKNGKGELIRNQQLLREMNDEMERSLNMEKEFNEGLQNILRYGERKRGE